MENSPQQALAGLFILTAIPVTSFALWCDYFENLFRARLEEKEEVDRGEELYRVRTAGFFILLFQLLVFFGTTPVRRDFPWVAYPLFLAAILIQLGVQRSLESKIHGSERKEGEPAFFWQALRTFAWSLAAGGVYVAVMMISVLGFSLIGAAFGLPTPYKVGLVLFGMTAGVVGGLSLNFALGAFFVRKMMNARAITEGPLYDELKSLFEETRVPAPDFWLVEIPQFHLGSAMMAGFPSGKGIFRPGFFISNELVGGLTPAEMRAVVLHEISHWRLRHLKKRFTFSTGLILCAGLLTGVSVLISKFTGANEQTQGIVGCVSLVVSFAFCFRLLAQQVKYQEFCADIHSVERLGSQLSDLASALRKLDRLHHNLPGRKDPGSVLLSMGHPATEYRIKILEKYFARKAEMAKAEASALPDQSSSNQESGSNDQAA